MVTLLYVPSFTNAQIVSYFVTQQVCEMCLCSDFWYQQICYEPFLLWPPSTSQSIQCPWLIMAPRVLSTWDEKYNL